jgi:hypothetical protein
LRPLHLNDWALAIAGGIAAGILSGLVGLTIRGRHRRKTVPTPK